MFKPVSPNVSFPELEQKALEFWQAEKIFEKSVSQHEGKKPFIFYEGPPTANGMPHPGHVLTRVIKDVFLRYWTMRGFHVPRRGGWDTHGLPVEVEVEKELGIHGRHEIERYGMEAFTRKCIDSVFRYIEEWRKMTQRIGFWVDLDDAYATFHKSYVESVWWALSEFFKQGLLYQDYKVVWWWPQGGTALSAGEVGQGYKTVDDASVVVKFPVASDPNIFLLAWTTTPWTLPSNVGLAVSAKETYCTVQTAEGEKWILAKARMADALKECQFEVLSEQPGTALEGVRYQPLFDYKAPEGGRAYEVITADFVTLDSGTGIVHVAPAFGEDDFRVAKEKGLGFLQLVKPDGTFTDEVVDFKGRFCKEADRDIIRLLRKRGSLVSEEVYRHEYPFCWRADQDPLIQYARRSWFVRTSKFVDSLLANNSAVHWEPEHIKDGRFGSFLRNNVDWALSRERFWGTPLPIWVNDETGAMDAVSSMKDILERNPNAFDHFHEAQKKDATLSEHLAVHKPWIDAVTWSKPGEPGVYRRVPEVIDCWFDSGCMPFAQLGYPHAHREALEANFPADFITEAVDQTRGWFYSLLAISTLLFPDAEKPHPFRNCVVLGHISDEKGQKLSKSKKNYEDPMTMISTLGGDSVRWSLYVSCVPGQNTRFFAGAATEAVREFLLKIWNVYSFFVTYARIDGWTPSPNDPPIAARSDMDRWILAELDETVRFVCVSLEGYRSHPAARRIQEFVDALSNWYVRRCRNRFWAEGDTADKRAAFVTLHEVLVELSKLVAPFVPFLADELYQNLARTVAPDAPISVHLADYPQPSTARADDALRQRMGIVRTVVALGQRVRATAKIKVRQPLSKAIVVVASDEHRQAVTQFEQAIRDELNVHEVVMTDKPEEFVRFQLVPNFRVLGPKAGKQLPEIKVALAKADGSKLHAELEQSGFVRLELASGEVQLTSEDIEIRLEAKEGFQAAAEHGQVVVLDSTLTEELKFEGLAREFVNRVQKSRKDMDLAFEQRIHIAHDASGELAAALEKFAEYVQGETLALSLQQQAALSSEGSVLHTTEIEGQTVRITLRASA